VVTKFVQLTLLLLGIGILCAAPVLADSADSVTIFTFESKPNPLGASETYTSGGLSLTAHSFGSNGQPLNLFLNPTPPTGTSLGRPGLGQGTGSLAQGNGFIELDITNILDARATGLTISITSLTPGSSWNVFQSNTLGDRGTEIASNQTALTFTLPSLGDFKFISIGRSTGSIVLDDVDVTLPGPIHTTEPSSAGLLMIGLGALVAAGTLVKKRFA
jgi:hypothetical protein